MSESLDVLAALVNEADHGRPAALCGVLHTRGSTPQQPGALLLLRADYSTVGTLGGGCVEAEVCKQAFGLLQHKACSVLDFVLDHDFGWDDGLICGGKMYVGLTSVLPDQADPYRQALQQARARQPVRIPIRVLHHGQTLTFDVSLEACPTLVIAGAGHVGQALAALAESTGFHVVVMDDRADFASRERFGDRVDLRTGDIRRLLTDWPIDASTYVVIVTRGHRNDHDALDAVIRRPCAYLGLIGSRRKSHLILKDLAAQGVPADRIEAVHTPIGLSIGAVTVREIAISIMAQLIQVRRQVPSPPVEGPIELLLP